MKTFPNSWYMQHRKTVILTLLYDLVGRASGKDIVSRQTEPSLSDHVAERDERASLRIASAHKRIYQHDEMSVRGLVKEIAHWRKR